MKKPIAKIYLNLCGAELTKAKRCRETKTKHYCKYTFGYVLSQTPKQEGDDSLGMFDYVIEPINEEIELNDCDKFISLHNCTFTKEYKVFKVFKSIVYSGMNKHLYK